MKEQRLAEKLFGTYGAFASVSNPRIPMRSNVFNSPGGGFTRAGGLGKKLFDADRKSPLLGNAGPSKVLSSWYSRVSESKQYELLDISRLAVSFFRDYVVNYLNTSTQEMVTILGEDGVTTDTQKTERINDYLSKDIKLFDFIRDHIDESIYYGAYYSGLRTKRDKTGHLRFHVYGLYDPVSVVIKRTLQEDEVTEDFIARGSDGNLYTLPGDECFYLGSPDLRLINDLSEDYNKYGYGSTKHASTEYDDIIRPGEKGKKPKFGDQTNRDRVIEKQYYTAGEPLFYSNLLKVKELVVKDLLVSLLSLRDLCTPSILALMFDKGVPMENAQELCAKVQTMMTSYNDLSSFLSAQFDVTSLIENILSQNVKVIPDYNATLQNKGLVSTDKLGDKYLELLQGLDQSRMGVLSPLGLPMGILDGTAGTKWNVLQSSERLNSRVSTIMAGIKESVMALVRTMYHIVYGESIDPALVKLHIFERSTVEYNSALNTIENISSIANGVSNIISMALNTAEQAGPILDIKSFASYIQNMVKNADPEASEIITEESIGKYVQLQQMKVQSMFDQFGGGMQ